MADKTPCDIFERLFPRRYHKRELNELWKWLQEMEDLGGIFFINIEQIREKMKELAHE